MKWFAIICILAIFATGFAIGPKCKGEDPKTFEGLSQAEIELICGEDNDSEKKAKRETLQEKCKNNPKFFENISPEELALLCPDESDRKESVKFAPHKEGLRKKL